MKRILLKTLALTMAMFLIGLYTGIVLDNMRLEQVKSSVTEIDNLWNDARLLQSYIQRLSDGNSTYYCNLLLKENLASGEKIYEEGVKVEENEKANRFTPTILLEKERYALLDLQFWLNSIDLKKACGANYSTVIYFYSQYNRTAEQDFQDRTLLDLKQKCGDSIIYITFPVDMDITTIDAVKDIYNITSVPSILINESNVLYGPQSLDDLEAHVSC